MKMSKNKLAEVFHFNLYGKRNDKYNFLEENSMGSIFWKELEVKKTNYSSDGEDFIFCNKILVKCNEAKK